MRNRDTIRSALGRGRPLVGSFVLSRDPMVSEIFAAAGFDFLVLDTEHSLNDVQSIAMHLRSCVANGIHAVVRLGGSSRADVSRLLDYGARAFMFPHFSAGSAGSHPGEVFYPPRGTRPTCTGVMSTGFGLRPFADVLREEDIFTIGLIEDHACVESLASVLDSSGIDAVVVGTGDLATSMGVHGEHRHPRVLAAKDLVKRAAVERGIHYGSYAVGADDVSQAETGQHSFVLYSMDYRILARACAEGRRQIAERLANGR